MSVNVEHAVWARSSFRRVDLGFPAGHPVMHLESVRPCTTQLARSQRRAASSGSATSTPDSLNQSVEGGLAYGWEGSAVNCPRARPIRQESLDRGLRRPRSPAPPGACARSTGGLCATGGSATTTSRRSSTPTSCPCSTGPSHSSPAGGGPYGDEAVVSRGAMRRIGTVDVPCGPEPGPRACAAAQAYRMRAAPSAVRADDRRVGVAPEMRRCPWGGTRAR